MTLEYAIRLAKKWANGDVCSLRDGEAEAYHRLCLDALREKKKQKIQKWISVDDKLPEDYVFVLVVAGNWERVVAVALYVDHKFYTQEAENTQIYVTHWMPLPEPPEDDA